MIARAIVWLHVNRRDKLRPRVTRNMAVSGMVDFGSRATTTAERVFAELLRFSVEQRRRAVPDDSEDYLSTRKFAAMAPPETTCQVLKLCEEFRRNIAKDYEYHQDSVWIVVDGVIPVLRREIVESLPAYREAPSRLPDDAGSAQSARVAPDLRAIW